VSIIHDALKKVEKEKKDRPPPVPEVQRDAPEETSGTGSAIRWPLHLFSFEKNLVGVDIGFSSIKAVKLKRKGAGCSLVAAAYEKIPLGTDGNAVLSSLKKIVSALDIEKTPVASVLTSKSLMPGHIYLPKIPEPDLRVAVCREVQKTIDFPGEAVIDYVVNKESNKDGKTRLSISTFAAKKADVLAHVDLLKEASLRPYAVDVCSMAILSAFDYNYGWKEGRRYAVIDVGASKTTLTILFNGLLRLRREIHFSGNDITWAIQDTYGYDFKSAEEQKLRYAEGVEEPSGLFTRAAKSFMEDLSMEILRSLVYYQAQHREGAVEEILLCGGGARLQGLSDYLESSTELPTSFYDTFRGVSLSENQGDLAALSPFFTVALGLALRRKGT